MWFRINYFRNWECFDQSCVNRTETVHGINVAFPVFISPIVWNMCENLLYESLYFKERHNQQEYYWPTIYRTGAVVVSTITCYYRANWDIPEKFSVLCMEYSPISFLEFFKLLCYKGNHFSFSFHYLSFSLVPWRRHYCRNVGEDS